MFDTFIDDKHDVQLKSFHRLLDEYHVGDSVPCAAFSFPLNPLFYSSIEGLVVVVKDGIFLQIIDPRADPLPAFPLFDKYGNRLSQKEFEKQVAEWKPLP